MDNHDVMGAPRASERSESSQDNGKALSKISRTLDDIYIISRESALNHIVGEPYTINSGNRMNVMDSSDSDFFFQFPAVFHHSSTRIVVLQASIPKSYYLVEDNELTVSEGEFTYSINLPKGNYNVVSFQGTLASLLTDASLANGASLLYTIDYNGRLRTVETGLLTIRAQGQSGHPIPIFHVGNTLYEQLGLLPNRSYNFTASSATSSELTSVNVCNFNLHSQLFIRSNICQNSQDNILQDIYTVSTLTNQYIIYENKSPALSSKRLNNDGQVYRFWLTDSKGNIIDLHGIEMSFSVVVY